MRAPAHWQTVDFVSDLHLHSSLPRTTEAFLNYLQQGVNGQRPDALFLLGDVFEVWVGDDALDPAVADEDPDNGYLQRCAAALAAAGAHTELHWMAGNRDFLLGEAACTAMGMRPLADPCPLILADSTVLLSHGDAGCTSDTVYQTFRREVRSADWQTRFLEQALPTRWAQARAIRSRSEAGKQGAPDAYADVASDWALAALSRHQASRLIHGHTHRPADHALPGGRSRWVLSDWDLDHGQPRAEVLRWHGGQWQRHSLLHT